VQKKWNPELLAPAGSLEKLKVAVLYGADAVYCGGQEFGLRTAAENFTLPELEEGVEFAHAHDSKVFVVLNGFLHDKDLISLPSFFVKLEQLKVDAVIVSDLGVIETVKQHSKIPVHLSTQASCLNIEAAKMWKSLGVERVVLGRESTIEEAARIKKETGLEVEMFIHGSMCMAYSGNCVISNYTSGRDSNRGGCAHSCRFEYKLEGEDQQVNSYFMSSKDLKGMSALPIFLDAQIDSLKVEGRMKGHLYAATVSLNYSRALNEYRKNKKVSDETLSLLSEELNKISHRDYTTASLISPAGPDSVYEDRENSDGDYVAVGVVVDSVNGIDVIIEVKKAFFKNDTLEFMLFNGEVIEIKAEEIFNLNSSETYEKTNPGTLVKIKTKFNFSPFTLVRRKLEKLQ
jgi:U32 family peptidase